MACLESLRWRQACASACLCLRGGVRGGGCLLLPAITCGCASATACLCLSSTNFIRLLVHAFIRLCLRAVCGRLRSPTFIRRAFFAKKGKGGLPALAFACLRLCGGVPICARLRLPSPAFACPRPALYRHLKTAVSPRLSWLLALLGSHKRL